MAVRLWVALAGLARQGSLGTVLPAGWAELAAPLLVGLVAVTGICERIWPAEPRPVLARGHVQDAWFLSSGAARPLRPKAGQLIEPFQARR